MLSFGGRREKQIDPAAGALAQFVSGFSIEVMPRTVAKVEDFAALFPAETRVYVAHIEGTPIEDMVATAKRLSGDGFTVMPHIPARIIENAAMLEEWLNRYREEAGIDQALLLAGGVDKPYGEFTSSMDLLETGLFEKFEFRRLHVAGHPEGNKDISPDGSTAIMDDALAFKQAYRDRTGIDMAIATQFAFDAKPFIAWAERIAANGITLPIHVGIAGPAKLQTLIKYALACGVGASMRVLQRRAADVTKLMMPYEPTEMLQELAAYVADHPESLIKQVHCFPLGGIRASAEWAARTTGAAEATAAAK